MPKCYLVTQYVILGCLFVVWHPNILFKGIEGSGIFFSLFGIGSIFILKTHVYCG